MKELSELKRYEVIPKEEPIEEPKEGEKEVNFEVIEDPAILESLVSTINSISLLKEEKQTGHSRSYWLMTQLKLILSGKYWSDLFGGIYLQNC